MYLLVRIYFKSFKCRGGVKYLLEYELMREPLAWFLFILSLMNSSHHTKIRLNALICPSDSHKHCLYFVVKLTTTCKSILFVTTPQKRVQTRTLMSS